MINTLRTIVFSLGVSLLLSACGGGGGGSTPAPPPTKAMLKISTANVPAGTLVGGVQIAIVLPAGVTPSVLSGNDASGSVVASGNASTGAITQSSYDAATRTLTPGTVSGTPFSPGEFLTVTCSIASGTTVTAADFPAQATVISLFDGNAVTIPGATCPISVTFQ